MQPGLSLFRRSHRSPWQEDRANDDRWSWARNGEGPTSTVALLQRSARVACRPMTQPLRPVRSPRYGRSNRGKRLLLLRRQAFT